MLAPSSICRVALLLGALAAAGAAPAGLSGARALYRQGRLSEALAAFEAALAAGGHAPTDLASIYLHLGILRAGSEDRAGSEAAFRALCALDPGAALPPGSSPTIAEPFARACSAADAASPPAPNDASEIGPPGGLPTHADLAPDPAPVRTRTSTTPAPAIVAGDPRAGAGESEATRADVTDPGTSPWLWIAIGLGAAAAGTAGAIMLARPDDRFAHVGSIRIEGP